MTTRARILDSAAEVVRVEGAGHLTLDAVAEHAKLSKGGVLYHFPNKRALIEGMLRRMLDDIERGAALRGAELNGANVRLRALTIASAERREEDAMSLAILAAAAEDPTLLDPVRETTREWFESVRREARDEQLAVLVLLAFEGLRFLEILDLLPLDTSATRKFRERLLKFAAQEV